VVAAAGEVGASTHNFHWNFTGPMFNTLHLMFMTQYTELWNAVDPIAERIRSLGHVAPGSYAQFSKLSSLSDAPSKPTINLPATCSPSDSTSTRKPHGCCARCWKTDLQTTKGVGDVCSKYDQTSPTPLV
jgi:hypothetical protein